MKGKPWDRLRKDVLSILRSVGASADKVNVPTYVVGGFVRDMFLGKENLDLDIVVDGRVRDLIAEWGRGKSARVSSYDRFGTATVEMGSGWRVDFAAARKEKYPFPGALPVVSRGSMQEDLARRDLSINAMAMSINRRTFGNILDDHGGRDALKSQKIAVLHQKSFEDDPTRILRAVRFEQRLGFRMDRQTLRLIRIAIRKDYPSTVKPQRYFSEFKKILMEQKPLRCITRLKSLNGLGFLGCRGDLDRQLFGRIEKKADHQLNMSLVYLMTLLYGKPAKDLQTIFKKFNLSAKDKRAILSKQQYLEVIRKLQKADRPSQVFAILNPLSKETVFFVRSVAQSRTVRRRIDSYRTQHAKMSLRINGDDLKALGIAAGPEIGKVLQAVLAQKLDHGFKSRRDEIKFAHKIQSSISRSRA